MIQKLLWLGCREIDFGMIIHLVKLRRKYFRELRTQRSTYGIESSYEACLAREESYESSGIEFEPS